MKLFNRPEQEKAHSKAAQWSEESQRRCLERSRLQGDLEKCLAVMTYHKKQVLAAEELCDHQARLGMGGDGVSDFHLAGSVARLQDLKGQLEFYERFAVSLQEKIAALALPQPARAEGQDLLATIARKRLEKDVELDAALQSFRRLLQERREFSARMIEAGAAVDFAFGDDGVDEARFAALYDSLPADLAGASEQWAARFLGQEENTRAYVVLGTILILPETLAFNGICPAGARVLLSDEQVRAFRSQIRPDEPGDVANGAEKSVLA